MVASIKRTVQNLVFMDEYLIDYVFSFICRNVYKISDDINKLSVLKTDLEKFIHMSPHITNSIDEYIRLFSRIQYSEECDEHFLHKKYIISREQSMYKFYENPYYRNVINTFPLYMREFDDQLVFYIENKHGIRVNIDIIQVIHWNPELFKKMDKQFDLRQKMKERSRYNNIMTTSFLFIDLFPMKEFNFHKMIKNDCNNMTEYILTHFDELYSIYGNDYSECDLWDNSYYTLWEVILKYTNSIELVEKIKNRSLMSWNVLADNHNLELGPFFAENIENFNFKHDSIYSNPNIAPFLEKHMDDIDSDSVTKNPEAISFLCRYPNFINWYYIHENPNAAALISIYPKYMDASFGGERNTGFHRLCKSIDLFDAKKDSYENRTIIQKFIDSEPAKYGKIYLEENVSLVTKKTFCRSLDTIINSQNEDYFLLKPDAYVYDREGTIALRRKLLLSYNFIENR